MSIGEIVAIAVAGLAAGAINTLVGSGTLITFPVLLAFGYAPVTANVSNTIGLVPGSVSGRRRLPARARRPARARAAPGGAMSLAGGITGAVLLLALPASAFKAIVPVFIAIALVLTVLQPRLARGSASTPIDLERGHGGAAARCSRCSSTGVYGGYFGAAQGILLLAILGVALAEDLQRMNALKNVLAGLVNRVAGRDLRVRRARRLGAGRADRRHRDRRRPARRALRPPAAAGGATRGDRRGGRVGDRAAARELSEPRSPLSAAGRRTCR